MIPNKFGIVFSAYSERTRIFKWEKNVAPKKNDPKPKPDKIKLPIDFGGAPEEKSSEKKKAESIDSKNNMIDDKDKKPKRKKKSLQEVLKEQNYNPLEAEKKRRKLLASAWKERNNIYRSIFGKPSYVSPKDYGPPSTEVPEDFLKKQEEQESNREKDTANPGDPSMEEQHLAVLAYGPEPDRPYWTYVTAGLASPWLQTERQEVSGFGCELLIKSPEDLPWAPQVLRTLAFYVFNHAGLLSPGVRLALNAPLSQKEASKIRNVFVWYADEVPNDLYQLPSGAFGIFACVGITDKELSYAESVDDYGTWCLQEVLRFCGHHQISNPDRACLTEEKDIEAAFATMKAKADSFSQFAPKEEAEDDFSF